MEQQAINEINQAAHDALNQLANWFTSASGFASSSSI